MKRLVTLLLPALLVAGAARAAPDTAEAQRDFVAANERALQGDHEGAVALYRSLLDRGLLHPDVHFNLGNALAAAGRPVDAVIAWERALRLAPGDRDAQANLASVRAQLGAGARGPTSDGGGERDVSLAELLEPLLGPIPATPLGAAAAAASALLFGLLALRRRAEASGQRRSLTAAAAFAASLLVATSLGVAGHGVIAREPRAVVRETAALKDGPHPRFKDGPALAAGARVRVLREDTGWLEVRDGDGATGWLPERLIERL